MMASSSNLDQQLFEIAIEEESEGGLDLEELGPREEEEFVYDWRLCLVGGFITAGAVDFPSMQLTLAALWKPGKGVYIKELDANRFLFQFFHEIDIKPVIEGSPCMDASCNGNQKPDHPTQNRGSNGAVIEQNYQNNSKMAMDRGKNHMNDTHIDVKIEKCSEVLAEWGKEITGSFKTRIYKEQQWRLDLETDDDFAGTDDFFFDLEREGMFGRQNEEEDDCDDDEDEKGKRCRDE
ncbi:hypothetical protein G4B88_005944 [Cannabis sativa]|uniref:DUF4283 domain-containing protein n=1 Tax=Cannabis sativa TaxID=3483 RepID=A0A7J6IBU5_CANSA|nr:hypothetical protein G4B88_005944 [Cannabis sativa]